MGRKKIEFVGMEFGEIKIIKERNPRNGHRRFITKCNICGAEEKIWYGDLNTGNYGKCSCEFKEMNVAYE